MTATIYNQYKNREADTVEWHRTVLSGERPTGGAAIHWEGARGVSNVQAGLNSDDATLVMIWFSVDAQGKLYIAPELYAELPPDEVTDYWTLGVSGLLFKGEITDVTPPLNKPYERIAINRVKTVDYCSIALRHWEVKGA